MMPSPKMPARHDTVPFFGNRHCTFRALNGTGATLLAVLHDDLRAILLHPYCYIRTNFLTFSTLGTFFWVAEFRNGYTVNAKVLYLGSGAVVGTG